MVNPYVSDEDLDRILDEEKRILEDALSDSKTDEVPPKFTVYGYDKGERVAIVALLPELGDNKDELFKLLGQEFSQRFETFVPCAVVLVAEVWVRKVPKEDPRFDIDGEELTLGALSDLEREEAVSISLLSWDSKVGFANYEIIRVEDDNIKLGECLTSHPSENTNSRAHLLQNFFTAWEAEKSASVFGDTDIDEGFWNSQS